MKKKENNIEENNELREEFESKKITLKLKNKKNLISLLVCISIMLVLLGIFLFSKKANTNIGTITPELMRSTTYAQVEDGDEKVDGTDYVEFDAFFLRDLDGDGYAESIRGTCREIGKEDTLYMNLKVLINGYLENGVITINSDNFYLQTAIPKDREIKENAIGNNIKRIELNKINNGTQKQLTGVIRSGDYTYSSSISEAIGNNINNYSKINSITLTGTHVADDGTRTEISKTAEFHVDWYGDVATSIIYTSQREDIDTAIDEENGILGLNFSVTTDETKQRLILSKSVVEGVIPELNGYAPIKVECTSSNVEFEYNEETRSFKVQRKATLNEETGEAISTISRRNTYNIKVTYPLEAYTSLGVEWVELRIPVTAYYEGYNNPNEEFTNPKVSNIARSTIIANYRKAVETVNSSELEIYVGKYATAPAYRYIVSKEKPYRIYNGLSELETDDTYTVRWYAYTGTNGQSTGLVLKETKNESSQEVDNFIKTDASTVSMEEVTTNVGVYFSNPENMLGEEG